MINACTAERSVGQLVDWNGRDFGWHGRICCANGRLGFSDGRVSDWNGQHFIGMVE